MKTYPPSLLAIALVVFSGFATIKVSASPTVADYVAEADAAYRNLPGSLSAYNTAVREICQAMQASTPERFAASLRKMGVSFDSPRIGLPLRRVQIATPPPVSNRAEAGIPIVLGYETKTAAFYPPEALPGCLRHLRPLRRSPEILAFVPANDRDP